jgi:hypothetical protein
LAAFIDLVLMANHDDNEIFFDGELLTVKRGQMITSVRKLEYRWGWSKTKITRYLKILESKKMITRLSDKKKTVITLINYGKYQDMKDSEKTVKNHLKDTEETQKNTNKNVKNDNNDKVIYNAEFETLLLFCEGKNILNYSSREKALFDYYQVLGFQDFEIAVSTAQNKSVEYLLKVLETFKIKKTKPQNMRSSIKKSKLKMMMSSDVEKTILDDNQYSEFKELAKLLDGGK